MALPTYSTHSLEDETRSVNKAAEELIIQTLQEGSCICVITGTSVFTAKISRVTLAFAALL